MAALPPGINAPLLLWSFGSTASRIWSRRLSALRKLSSSSADTLSSGTSKKFESELVEEYEVSNSHVSRVSICSTSSEVSYRARLGSLSQAVLSSSKNAAVQSVTKPLQTLRRGREALAAVGNVLLDDIKGNPMQRR
eukprot:CAMPEP_0181236828 /NCGR_PEP_ID=MMETSP1096-20121128/38406_1 /TAXON_ID=156174 ORGANISM="Chrysochromulina ericina, Strain CCMP281" /NCGR_SAMPLE_ID=MMETSP1096 /ASSEMBLY_ACC=CAM_ASM_000453 /LENGTH=136 /DNA_ID=CAMNT_0023332079 /DNA_START=11 /DNA_END=417 /DNA_ORIENTATION=+